MTDSTIMRGRKLYRAEQVAAHRIMPRCRSIPPSGKSFRLTGISFQFPPGPDMRSGSIGCGPETHKPSA